MYRVFLVEDEIVVRESIRDNVPWEGSPFTLAGEAADGEMALPLLEEIRPDILITDIKMPFMDGLELARIVRKNMPLVKIVIISGHDQFTFAREAIGIGVTEYLLKPVSAADLLGTLERIAGQIEKEARERESLESLTRCYRDSRQVMAERFLNDLVTGVVPSAEAIEKARGFGLSLVGRCYIVAVVTPEVDRESEPQRVYGEHLKAEGLIQLLLQDNPDVAKFSRSLKEIVLVFRGENPEELESHCFAVCQSLKYEVERKTACTLTINIGSARERIQGIAESFAEAETAARFHYIFGRNRIVGIDDARRVNLGGDILRLDCGAVVEALRSGGREDLQRELRGYLERVRGGGMSSFFLGYAMMNVLLAVAKFVEELGGDAQEALPAVERVEELLAEEQRLEEVLLAAFEFRENCRRNRYADLLLRARAFIAENYGNPNLSLNTIARQVTVSPSHFSTIFSQETGRTVIEHLTGVRMGRARELLRSTSLRSSEIAYKVGYKDPHYFSYLFKRVCGCTPSEFREGGTAAGGEPPEPPPSPTAGSARTR